VVLCRRTACSISSAAALRWHRQCIVCPAARSITMSQKQRVAAFCSGSMPGVVLVQMHRGGQRSAAVREIEQAVRRHNTRALPCIVNHTSGAALPARRTSWNSLWKNSKRRASLLRESARASQMQLCTYRERSWLQQNTRGQKSAHKDVRSKLIPTTERTYAAVQVAVYVSLYIAAAGTKHETQAVGHTQRGEGGGYGTRRHDHCMPEPPEVLG
jgi:hypothetical protein